MMKFSQAISWVKWLSGEKTNVVYGHYIKYKIDGIQEMHTKLLLENLK
jgi:hypothetical protein